MSYNYKPGPADVDYYEGARVVLREGIHDGDGLHGFRRTIKEAVKVFSAEAANSETYARHKPSRAEIREQAHQVVDDVFEDEFGIDELSRRKERNQAITQFGD